MRAVISVCVYVCECWGGGVLRYIETLCHFRRHVLLPQAGVMTDGDRHQAEGHGEVKRAQWFLKTEVEEDKRCCCSQHSFLLSLAFSG